MLVLDKPIAVSVLRQFASQLPMINESELATLAKMWQGDQSDDVCKGIAQGLAAAYQMFGLEEPRQAIGQALAFVADKMEQREIF